METVHLRCLDPDDKETLDATFQWHCPECIEEQEHLMSQSPSRRGMNRPGRPVTIVFSMPSGQGANNIPPEILELLQIQFFRESIRALSTSPINVS